MTADDHAARARTLEAAGDWEGAGAAWNEALRSGHPDAAHAITRARRAMALTHELCSAAADAIDRGEIREAVEPLRASIELSGEHHAIVAPLVRAWRDKKRDFAGEQRRAWKIVRGIALCVGTAAIIALAVVYPPGIANARVKYVIVAMAGMSIGAGAGAVARLFFPVLRQGSVARLKLTRPERRDAEGAKVPDLRARTSRTARWKRAAEQERAGGRGFWE